MSDLVLHIERQGNELRLVGEFDRLDVDRFKQAVHGDDGRALEIEMSGLTFVDSAALRELISARRLHPQLRYVNPAPALRRLAEITGTAEILFGP